MYTIGNFIKDRDARNDPAAAIRRLANENDQLRNLIKQMIEVERLRRRVTNDDYHGDSYQDREYIALRDAVFGREQKTADAVLDKELNR